MSLLSHFLLVFCLAAGRMYFEKVSCLMKIVFIQVPWYTNCDSHINYMAEFLN